MVLTNDRLIAFLCMLMLSCPPTLKSEKKLLLLITSDVIGQTQNPDESRCTTNDEVAASSTHGPALYSNSPIDEAGQAPGSRITIEQSDGQPDTVSTEDLPNAHEPLGSWFGLSFGKAFVRGESERSYLAAGVSYHYRFRSNLISVRFNALPYPDISGESFPFNLRLRFLEVGALYGKVIDMSFGHVSFSAGCAAVLASSTFPGPVEFTALGIPVEIQALATTSGAGIGLSLISNINSGHSFAGAKVIVGFGSLQGHQDAGKTNPGDFEDRSMPQELRIAKSIGFGLLGCGVGFGLGSLIVELASHPHGEDAGLALFAGGIVGAPIVMPIGVHLGNDSRGNLALDYLPLLGTGAGALLLVGNAHDASPYIILGIVDFAATILIEHLMGH